MLRSYFKESQSVIAVTVFHLQKSFQPQPEMGLCEIVTYLQHL